MTNYKEKHDFEPSGEFNELKKELCKCGLPLDIPSMHFQKEVPKCKTVISKNGIEIDGHSFLGFKCVNCPLVVDQMVLDKVEENNRKAKENKKHD